MLHLVIRAARTTTTGLTRDRETPRRCNWPFQLLAPVDRLFHSPPHRNSRAHGRGDEPRRRVNEKNSKIRDADNTPAMRTRLPDHGARTCRWHSDGTCGARMHAALQIIANANSIFSPRADCEWTGVHGVPLSARTRRRCECYTPESRHFCALRLLTMMAW